MTAIQFVSDIHLETRDNTSKDFIKKILIPFAPYLALCGDIGYPGAQLYEPFLEYCSKNFEHVFYVPGNHEFYNTEKALKFKKYRNEISSELQDDNLMKGLESKFNCDTRDIRSERIRNLCSKYPNIHYLDKDIYHIPNTDIVVVGCTLWTNVQISRHMLPKFNDFNKIFEDKDNLLTSETYNKWNLEDMEFLNTIINQLNKDDTVSKIVVLTHHCPTHDIIIDKYKEAPYNFNSFFANDDLDHLFGNKVKVWLCGHTHGCNSINKNSTTIATNTLGYSGENVEGFNSTTVIYI